MICLICLADVKKSKFPEYHETCFRALFGTTKLRPELSFSRKEFFEVRSTVATKRLSISGVQPKLAVRVENGKLETTNQAFTHIIKPSPEDYPEAAENEHLTMKISQLVGIKTALCGLVRFSDGEFVYITKRFDLISPDEKIHQEDMMQAMGVHPELFRNAKYEAKSYEDVAIFLKTASSIMITKELFERIFFNYMVSNNDYHLKNITIQFQKELPGGMGMSPHYDALNTGLYGVPDSELACSLVSNNNGFTEAFEKYGYHTKACFEQFAKVIGLGEKVIEKIFNNYLNRFDQIVDLVSRSPLTEMRKQKYLHELNERKTKFLRSTPVR